MCLACKREAVALFAPCSLPRWPSWFSAVLVISLFCIYTSYSPSEIESTVDEGTGTVIPDPVDDNVIDNSVSNQQSGALKTSDTTIAIGVGASCLAVLITIIGVALWRRKQRQPLSAPQMSTFFEEQGQVYPMPSSPVYSGSVDVSTSSGQYDRYLRPSAFPGMKRAMSYMSTDTQGTFLSSVSNTLVAIVN